MNNDKLFWYQNPKDGTLKGASYTAEKDAIMKATCDNFLSDLRRELEDLQYKYVNNTRLFDTEQDYVNFCRAQIQAATLKMMAKNLELQNA